MEADILTSEGKIEEASAMVEAAAGHLNKNEITLITVKASILTTQAFTILNQGPNQAQIAQSLFAVIIIIINNNNNINN